MQTYSCIWWLTSEIWYCQLRYNTLKRGRFFRALSSIWGYCDLPRAIFIPISLYIIVLGIILQYIVIFTCLWPDGGHSDTENRNSGTWAQLSPKFRPLWEAIDPLNFVGFQKVNMFWKQGVNTYNMRPILFRCDQY